MDQSLMIRTLQPKTSILGWERDIIKSLPSSTDIADFDLEMQAIVYEWKKGSAQKAKEK